MSEEGKLGAQLQEAINAERELELCGQAFDTLEAEYLKAWKATSARDTDARERLFIAVQIVGKVRDHLKSVANGRKMIEKQLAEVVRYGEKRFNIFGRA